MEPTIRKGEQTPEENPQQEDLTNEVIPDQEFPIPAIDDNFMSEEIEPLQVDDDAAPMPEINGQISEDNPPQALDEMVPGAQPELPVDVIETGQGEEAVTFQAAQEDQIQASVENGPSEVIEPISLEQENPISEAPASEYPGSEYTTDFLPIPTLEEAPQQTNPRKVALILSGGGARGAFQVGAEKYAREVRGYQWDIIAGVSVGAMNGAMLAMHRYARLLEIWQTITDRQVYTGGFNLLSVARILFGARSFYGNRPLQKLMQGEFAAGRIIEDLRVGAVSLSSGEYVQFTKESLELSKAILASASIPVIWPPVDVSLELPAMVDGGVRNITPIGDVLELEPDEIVIINCGNATPAIIPSASANVLSIGMRALDIMQNEIFVNDMKQFLRINALVKEAEQQGCVLHHPKSGRPYKYFPYQVIEPDVELGGILDFSQLSVQASLRVGVRRAREVLGRP